MSINIMATRKRKRRRTNSEWRLEREGNREGKNTYNTITNNII